MRRLNEIPKAGALLSMRQSRSPTLFTAFTSLAHGALESMLSTRYVIALGMATIVEYWGPADRTESCPF